MKYCDVVDWELCPSLSKEMTLTEHRALSSKRYSNYTLIVYAIYRSICTKLMRIVAAQHLKMKNPEQRWLRVSVCHSGTAN